MSMLQRMQAEQRVQFPDILKAFMSGTEIIQLARLASVPICPGRRLVISANIKPRIQLCLLPANRVSILLLHLAPHGGGQKNCLPFDQRTYALRIAVADREAPTHLCADRRVDQSSRLPAD